MKKLFLSLVAFAMTLSFTSCGEDEPEGKGDGEKNYKLVYNAWMPTDLLKFADVELSVYDPATDKTTTYNISNTYNNMFGAEGYELFDNYLKIAAILHQFDANNDFVYYHIADDIKDGMKYEASIKCTINEDKIAALPDDNTLRYSISDPEVFSYVIDDEGGLYGNLSFSISNMEVTKEKAIEYLRKYNEASTISGTINLKAETQE